MKKESKKEWIVLALAVHILKSKDFTLSTKVHIVKAMIFPVVMCKCESWTIKEGGSGWGMHVNPWLTHVNV